MSTEISFPAINEGVKLPMRFYKSWKRMNNLRKVCIGDCKYKLITPANEMLPFQLYVDFKGPYTITWKILNENEEVVYNPDTDFLTTYEANETITYFVYKSDLFDFTMPRGFYTAEVTISSGGNTVTWYSEEFYSLGTCDGSFTSCPDLCDNDCWESSVNDIEPDYIKLGSSPNCTIVRDGTGNVSTLTFTDVFPDSNTQYRFSFNLVGTEPGNTLHFNFGGGTQIDFNTSDGTFEFFGTNDSGTDLIITASINFIGVFKQIYISPQSVKDIFSCHKTLVWYNDCGVVGEIYYGASSFNGVMYLEEDVEIINSTPKIYIEGVENGEKDLIPTFQKRTTVYTMELGLQPPYIIEALNEMSIHKFIKLKMEDDLGESFLKAGTVNFKVDYTESGACLFPVTMTFELDDTTVTDGCCNDNIVPELVCVQDDIIADEDFSEVADPACTPNVAADPGWTDITVNGGKYCFTSGGELAALDWPCLDVHFTHKLTVVVTGYSGGDLSTELFNDEFPTINADGTYVYNIDHIISNTAAFISSGFIGCIEISLQVIAPKWERTGFDWIKTDDGYCHTPTGNGALTNTDGGIVAGETYSVPVSVDVTTGSFTLHVGGVTNVISTSGLHIFTVTAIVDDEFYIVADTNETEGCVVFFDVCKLG